MWKTEQQTAASTSFRPFPFPLQLWEIAHCSLTERGKGESPICAFTSCPNMSSSGHKQVYLRCVFPLMTAITHITSAFTCGKVTVRNVLLTLNRKALWTPMLSSSEVCVRSSTQFVHHGLDEWLYGFNEKKVWLLLILLMGEKRMICLYLMIKVNPLPTHIGKSAKRAAFKMCKSCYENHYLEILFKKITWSIVYS